MNSSDDVAAISSSSAFFDNLIPQNMSTLEIPVTEGMLHEECFCPLRRRGEEGKTGKLRETRKNLVHSSRQILLKHMTPSSVMQHISLSREILFPDKRPIKNTEESSR